MAVEPRPPEDRRRLETWALRCAEGLLALGAVLVFFFAFMGILSLSFPEGSGLHNLLERPSSLADPRESNIAIDLAPEDLAAQSFVAVLDDIQRKVKEKRVDSVSWEAARGGQRLGDRHSVQTYDDARATIAFDEGSRLVLGENSLVIVRRLEERPEARQKRASVVLLGGVVEGKLGPAAGEMELEVVTGGATSRIRRSGSRETDFRMVSHGDRAATLQVFDGVAEFESGGRKVRLTSDSWARLSPDGRVTGPLVLPGAPALAAPAAGAHYAFREQPPEVRFAWEPGANAESYRLEIARDAEFRDGVLDSRVEQPEFVHGSLAPGRYFWRVSSLIGEAKSRPGPARAFELERDREAPALVVEFPQGPVSEASLVVRGRTEPGVEVYVAGRKTALTESGTFEERIDLLPGTSVVVVEAYDAAGNVTTRSSPVHARFQAREVLQ